MNEFEKDKLKERKIIERKHLLIILVWILVFLAVLTCFLRVKI
mgnify:CR=1 FL=1